MSAAFILHSDLSLLCVDRYPLVTSTFDLWRMYVFLDGSLLLKIELYTMLSKAVHSIALENHYYGIYLQEISDVDILRAIWTHGFIINIPIPESPPDESDFRDYVECGSPGINTSRGFIYIDEDDRTTCDRLHLTLERVSRFYLHQLHRLADQQLTALSPAYDRVNPEDELVFRRNFDSQLDRQVGISQAEIAVQVATIPLNNERLLFFNDTLLSLQRYSYHTDFGQFQDHIHEFFGSVVSHPNLTTYLFRAWRALQPDLERDNQTVMAIQQRLLDMSRLLRGEISDAIIPSQDVIEILTVINQRLESANLHIKLPHHNLHDLLSSYEYSIRPLEACWPSG